MAMECKGSPWMGSVILSLLIGLSITAAVRTADELPKSFKYIHLCTSQDGETHIKECKMHNFTLQPHSSSPQYERSDFGGLPMNMVFTELSIGLMQPLHSPPAVQFVIAFAGAWYIKTTDGSKIVFKHGQVLFQHNIVGSPADKVPQHYSGNVGNTPCQQFVLQFNRTAEVDHSCPF